jgi:hypothetical protein
MDYIIVISSARAGTHGLQTWRPALGGLGRKYEKSSGVTKAAGICGAVDVQALGTCCPIARRDL